ncbi:MAG: nicotinamide mononucleotide transporter [Cyanobacteria bacterium SIG27]|nr:nicotinamide mononucleotide transporter [Cyanobacteria bacterium SIG27]
MNLKKFVIQETKGFNLFEKIFFPLEILLIIVISIILNDNKIALISAIAGISYTILAGKGKISCYIIGLCGTFCYCYIAFKNGFYGNLALYGLYFFPMQVIGLIKWKKHIKKETGSIKKTCLNTKERMFYSILALVLSIILSYILFLTNDKNPIIDSIVTILSIIAQILTIKRCIEQWYLWLVVNVLTFIMWSIAYINGSNCFATIIMWGTYIFLAVYFLHSWKKELTSNEENI